MFRKISIEKYRGLHNITFSELGQINILVGDNNSGKTLAVIWVLMWVRWTFPQIGRASCRERV